ncbi:MAG: AAA family ATPase [Isosphaerales bacterium]
MTTTNSGKTAQRLAQPVPSQLKPAPLAVSDNLSGRGLGSSILDKTEYPKPSRDMAIATREMGADARREVLTAEHRTGTPGRSDRPVTGGLSETIAIEARKLGLTPSPINSMRPAADTAKAEVDAYLASLEGGGFVNILSYLEDVPTEIPWLVGDFAYLHGVTLVSGSPKAGKSTFCAQVMRCREIPSAQFLGTDVEQGPTCLVTEESGIPVRYKVGALQHLDIFDRRMAGSEPFEQTLARIASWAANHPRGLVFIDTFSVWAQVEDENDASKVTAVMDGINKLAANNDIAVVLVHHSRKGGGKDGEAIRGSGAILATVDHSIELSRVDKGESTDRWVNLMGRVLMPYARKLAYDPFIGYTVKDETPDIEEEVGDFPIHGYGEGLSMAKIADLWNKPARTRVAELVAKGVLYKEETKTSRGSKKMLYWRFLFSSEVGVNRSYEPAEQTRWYSDDR